MGQRCISNTSQFFELHHEVSRGQPATGQSYVHIGRAVALQNRSFPHPMDNISTTGLDCASWRALESRSIELSSTNFRFERPQIHPSLSGPTPDIFPHFPAGGNSYLAPQINVAHAHSSHNNRHVINEVEGGLSDPTMGTGRGPFKRKSHSISVSWERDNASSVFVTGSSSNSFEPQIGTPISDYRNCSSMSASIGVPSHLGGSLSIGCEDTPRNVRSRSRHDLSPSARRNLSRYSSHPYFSNSHLQNHAWSMHAANLNANAAAYEQSQVGVFPPLQGRFQASANNSLSFEMNQNCVGRSPTDNGGYHHDFVFGRNPVPPPQYVHGFHTQLPRGGHSNYSQRALPMLRTDLSFSSFSGQEAARSESGQQFLSEIYPSRYARPSYAGSWHNNHGEGRSRLPIERFQPLPNAVDARDRMGSETLVTLDRTYLYGSRNLFDQYGDMRLDIDNMSYEELLALGERIGNVNTGLSEDEILKCLIETHCVSAEENREETSCAICLEEYKNTDKVEVMKNCGHGYHSDCIRKWLSMKNACPICKATAIVDGV